MDHPTAPAVLHHCGQEALLERIVTTLEAVQDRQGATESMVRSMHDRLLTVEVSHKVADAVAEKYAKERVNGKSPFVAAIRAVPPWGWVVVGLVRGPEVVEVALKYAMKALGVE
jgi:hypothetical protein